MKMVSISKNESAGAELATKPGSVKHQYIVFAGLAILLIALPFFVYTPFLMKVLCFALFASALSLLAGYGGLLSFGHAAFFGMASYACAHAAKVWELSPLLAILFGTVVAGLLGLVIGALAIRRQGIYFSMVTLAFAQMIYFFCLRAPFTHAEDGIQHVPRGEIFGISLADNNTLYWLVAAIFFASVLFIYRVINSPFGQVLIAIREHEPRATSLGYRVYQYKLLVFVLSATLAGLAGSMKAIVNQLASLADVHWSMSGEVVLMMILGGMGTIFGPIIGAAVIATMQDYLAWLGPWVTVLQGAIFVICVLLFRKGIIGIAGRWLKI
jgi:branched-chain amino acid transport system permease protein